MSQRWAPSAWRLEATLDQQSADDKLADVEADTARLQGDMAEYAHVPVVMAALDRETTVRGYGMSHGGPLASLLRRHLRHGASWRAYREHEDRGRDALLSQTAAVLDPLAAVGAATVEFTAQAATIADIEGMMGDGLALVPGFSVPWYTEAMLGAAGDPDVRGDRGCVGLAGRLLAPVRSGPAAAAAAADAGATDGAAEGDD